jgi:hypothetical protein
MSTLPTLPDNSLAWLVDNESINFLDQDILSEHVECFKVGCEKPTGADEKALFCTPERWDMHMKRCRFMNTPEADILALGFGPERGRYADAIYETAMSLREMSKIRERLLSESAKPQLLCWDWDGTISVIEGMLKDVYLALDSFNSKATDNDIDGSLELQDLVLYYLGGQQRIDAFLETFRLANSLGIKQIVLTANGSTSSIQHLLNHLFEEEGYDFKFLEQDVRYIFDPQWSAAGAEKYEQTKIKIIAAHLKDTQLNKKEAIEYIHNDIYLNNLYSIIDTID